MKNYNLRTCEVARILGKSPRCVVRLITSGQLPAIKSGRTFRVSESDLREYVERSRVIPSTEYSEEYQAAIDWQQQQADDRYCAENNT